MLASYFSRRAGWSFSQIASFLYEEEYHESFDRNKIFTTKTWNNDARHDEKANCC